MPNPFQITLIAADGYKYVDITDLSDIGTEGNILPPAAQIGDQVYYDRLDSTGSEVFIDGGGNVTASGNFDYWYYTDTTRLWGPKQRYGEEITVSYNLIGGFRDEVILQGSFRPDITLTGRLAPA